MERLTQNLVVLLFVGVIGLCHGTSSSSPASSTGTGNPTTVATTVITGHVTDITGSTEPSNVTDFREWALFTPGGGMEDFHIFSRHFFTFPPMASEKISGSPHQSAPDATTVVRTTVTSATTDNLNTTTGEPQPEPGTTTPRPIPAKPPIGIWTAKDDKNKASMKVQFGARFKIPFYNTSNQIDVAVIDAPLTAHPIWTRREGDPDRDFRLSLFNDGPLRFFDVTLTFSTSNSSNNYKMTSVGSLYTIDPRLFKNPRDGGQEWQSVGSDNWLNNSVPLEKSFTCGHTLPFSGVYVTFYDVKFMPYAEEAHGDFGESVTCKNANNGLSFGTTIFVIVVIVVVIALIVVGVVFGYRKYKSRSKAEDRSPIIQQP